MINISKKIVLATLLVSSFSFAQKIKEDCSVKSKKMFKTYCLQKEFEKGDYSNVNTLLSDLYYDYQDNLMKKYLTILAKKDKLHLVKDLYSTRYKFFQNELLKQLDIKAIEKDVGYNTIKLNKWYKKILKSKKYDKYVEFVNTVNYIDLDKAYNLLKIASDYNNAKATYELTKYKYKKFITKEKAHVLLEKAGKLGNYDALIELYTKDKKWIKEIKKLDEKHLLTFYQKYQKYLDLKNKKAILKRLVSFDNTEAIYIKLDSINMHKHAYNEYIKELSKKYPFEKFKDTKPKYPYIDVKNDIVAQYLKNNNISALLYKSTYSNETEAYFLSRNNNIELYALALQYAKSYTNKSKAIEICEKLSKKGFQPAKNLLISLYLKEKIYKDKNQKEKVDKLANELAKKNNMEALYYQTIKDVEKKEDYTDALFRKSFKILAKMEKLNFYPATKTKYKMYKDILKKRKDLLIYKDVINIIKKEAKQNNENAKNLLYLVK